jgi:hypothetical protein
VKEIVAVDNAACNNTDREIFLNLCSRLPSFHPFYDSENDTSFFFWMHLRKISLQKINLGEIGVALLPIISVSRITSLKMEHINTASTNKKVFKFINKCKLLTELSMDRVEVITSNDFRKIDLNILKQLTSLEISTICTDYDESELLNQNLINYLAANCTNLEKLHLLCNSNEQDSFFEISKLLQNNPHLYELTLNLLLSKTVLTKISKLFGKQLKHFECDRMDNCTAIEVVSFMKKLPNLQYLRMYFCDYLEFTFNTVAKKHDIEFYDEKTFEIKVLQEYFEDVCKSVAQE